jgi:hypothetical protein
VSLGGIAQTKLKFTYSCSNSVLETTQVSVYLKDANNKIELLNDTVREFKDSLSIPAEETDYILSVEFENKTIGKETLNYPFTFIGNEIDIEINVSYYKNNLHNKKKRENGGIEVITYYESNHDVEIQYLPDEKGDEYFKAPFFMLKNNSKDTIYGKYLNHFWGSISFLVDTVWSREIIGRFDLNCGSGRPLFPDSVGFAQVGTFGWRNDLPKNRYKYTLWYTIGRVRQYLEKDNFVWRVETKKYYRLIYEFDVE